MDTAVVLAAGAGTRMKSQRAKVLHEVAGKPLLGHVLAAVGGAGAGRVVVVVGHGREQVADYLAATAPDVLSVVQAEQLGTGHAVRAALSELPDPLGTVTVLAGDTPLLRPQTLAELSQAHRAAGAAATVLTARLADPTGYGRIVRTSDGLVERIVEEKDATDAQRAIDEINSGVYVFAGEALADGLAQIGTDNAQGEEYLTDVIGVLAGRGLPIVGHLAADADEIHGINDRAQLAVAGALLRDRINTAWMRAGVTIVDPATTWIDADARLAADAVVHRNSHIAGRTMVAAGAVVGPDTTLVDCQVGTGAIVLRSHCVGAAIGESATVGPFSYLRPGADLHRSAKAGAFVEIKNATVGPAAKVPHLSYVGDAQIGEGSNIGAATVFVNYDGVAKHRTVIGAQVRIGSDTMLVAPVTVGDGAYTAAGSVITDDVPPGALALGRARQRNLDGWVQSRRAGSSSADAARAALDNQ